MSARFTLSKEDGKKILKGFGIALAGTSLAYIADVLNAVDFGDLQPVAVILLPVLMAAINAAIKWTKDNQI